MLIVYQVLDGHFEMHIIEIKGVNLILLLTRRIYLLYFDRFGLQSDRGEPLPVELNASVGLLYLRSSISIEDIVLRKRPLSLGYIQG